MSYFPGLYQAVVVDRDDPEESGRIKVRVPAFGNEDAWARPCLPLVASGVEVPVQANVVWVMFEGGDPAHPVVMGVSPA